MIRASLGLLGVVLLALVWLGPLPDLAQHSFAAHMSMHMAVVAVAAPLVALALSRRADDPVFKTPGVISRDSSEITPGIVSPIVASMIELVVVWGWHAPALHQAAREHTWALVAEQGSFLLAGATLWITTIGRDAQHASASQASRAGAGVVALLFTSMHMTLLGALIGLANRPLFQHVASSADALSDQHLGGAIMLIVGGTSYLMGGLWLTGRMLGVNAPAVSERKPFDSARAPRSWQASRRACPDRPKGVEG